MSASALPDGGDSGDDGEDRWERVGRQLLAEELEMIPCGDLREAFLTAKKRVDNGEELTEHIRILEEHHPKLPEELREVVCENSENGGAAESSSSDDVGGNTNQDGRTDVEAEEDISDDLQTQGRSNEEAAAVFGRDRVEGLEYNRNLTDPRLNTLLQFLKWAKSKERGVKKGDFVDEFWDDERTGATGYNPDSFWEAFAKAAMKQLEEFQKSDARTYRYTGANSE